jgi:hypothetical protein
VQVDYRWLMWPAAAKDCQLSVDLAQPFSAARHDIEQFAIGGADLRVAT